VIFKICIAVNFDQYVQKIRTTSEWGGQLEIQALSNALKIPIWIYSAEAPVVKMGENYQESPIRLTYVNFKLLNFIGSHKVVTNN
jgi:OTU domain-containing protein 6